MSPLVITLYALLVILVIGGGFITWLSGTRGSGLPEMKKPEAYYKWKHAPDSRAVNCRCVVRPVNVNPPPTYAKPPMPSAPKSSAPHYRFVKRNGVYFWTDDPWRRRVARDPDEVLEASVAWIMARHYAEHPEDFREKP